MPKSLNSLDDHLADIVEARRRTQAGRFQRVAPGTERVADVMEGACAQVAQAFAEQGFRWARSGLHFSRKQGGFTHIVSFQADSENTSGLHVGVSMHVRVKSAELARWREAQGVTTGDHVWAAQVGYLSPAHEYLKWQLADPASRTAEVASMVATVRELALPALEVCSSKEQLSLHLLERREITWIEDWAVDIALWLGNKPAAEALLQQYLMSSPRVEPQFAACVAHECQSRSPSRPDHRLHALAWVALKHGLAMPKLG